MYAEKKLADETDTYNTDEKVVIEQEKLLQELALAIEKEQKEVDVLVD